MTMPLSSEDSNEIGGSPTPASRAILQVKTSVQQSNEKGKKSKCWSLHFLKVLTSLGFLEGSR